MFTPQRTKVGSFIELEMGDNFTNVKTTDYYAINKVFKIGDHP